MRKMLVSVMMVMSASVFAQTPIRVYVQPIQLVGGIVDKDTKAQQDSLQDLIEQLQKKSSMTLVDHAEHAQVVIRMVKRDAAFETGGTSTNSMRVMGGAIHNTEKDVTKMVIIQLQAGDYTKEFSAQRNQAYGAWKEISKDLAKQVDQWAKENARALVGAQQ